MPAQPLNLCREDFTSWESGLGTCKLAALTLHPHPPQGTASSEVNATEEMSTLVNYIEPVKFKSFQAASSECGGLSGGAERCGALRSERLGGRSSLCSGLGWGQNAWGVMGG